MDREALISLEEFCRHHEIEVTFIQSLRECNLIEVVVVSDQPYIRSGQLPRLEKMVRLYYDLDINLEGIEVINGLLERIENMQKEIGTLRNRLNLFDEG
jgi:hypothetical protein